MNLLSLLVFPDVNTQMQISEGTLGGVNLSKYGKNTFFQNDNFLFSRLQRLNERTQILSSIPSQLKGKMVLSASPIE